MEFVSTRTAKAKLSHYLNSLKEKGPVVITSRGLPKGILIPFSDEDLDGLVIRQSEKVREMVMEGLSDIRGGKTYSVREASRILDKGK